jgi:ribosomal protein S3
MVSRRPCAAAHAARRCRLRYRRTAHTAYGTNGIKVWIFKGEILEHDPMAQDKRIQQMQEGGGPRPAVNVKAPATDWLRAPAETVS